MDRATALNWIERWDRQQECSLPSREDRFTAMIDALEAAVGRADPVVLDIGCGPGSLTVRIMERLPDASVIGVDADPVTLALARTAYPQFTFEDLDLRNPDWTTQLGLDGKADAVVSTTALHWLAENDLRAVYRDFAALLRPGGIVLDGDHFTLSTKETPVLARLDQAVREAEDKRRFPRGHRESWLGWWEQVAQDPDLAPFSQERDRRRVEAGHHGSETGGLAVHVDALRAAGFAEVGTLWQYGDQRILAAVLPD
jgi:SAM-dependent methyltransferase